VGRPVGGLTAAQQTFFTAAQARFQVIETVPAGLGPGFNELSCGNCHISPAVGGSSPTTNPQVTDANTNGATAPLWGIGQRVYFLHDGRTNNLLTAIEQHASSGSEANQVIGAFNMLSTTDQQNILNFLRDL
jgi:CxxC motif-containing protein (DUF1111 family)